MPHSIDILDVVVGILDVHNHDLSSRQADSCSHEGTSSPLLGHKILYIVLSAVSEAEVNGRVLVEVVGESELCTHPGIVSACGHLDLVEVNILLLKAF